MYNDFFSLDRSPFDLSPDPFFLYSSEKSKDALASISHAISRRKGFVVMTGEVGTGKTLILRCLFELWEREQVPFAYFIGPRLSTMDFLRYITFELGITVAEPTKGNLLRALYGFLLAQFEKDLTTVLVIDEAHQIPQSVLEEVRLLANFETAQQKLLQILLVGQPELDKKLDSVELRSLKQRIAVRCHLEPLRGEEIRRYIERRLELAGADPRAAAIFPAETTRAIESYSLGTPRLINSICDQALMLACARQLRVVPVEIIDEVASRFRLAPAPVPKQTEKPFPPASRVESFAPDRSAQAVPAPHVPASRVPAHRTPYSDAAVKLQADPNGKPATPPIAPESSPRAEIRDIFAKPALAAAQEATDPHTIRGAFTDFGVQRLKEAAEAVCLQSDPPDVSVATATLSVPSAAQSPEPAWERLRTVAPAVAPAPSARSTRSIILDLAAPEKAEKNAPASRDAAFRSDHVLRAARSFRLRRRLTPALLLALVIGTAAAAVVAVALPAAVFMARRQRPVTVLHPSSSVVQNLPSPQAAAPVQPVSAPLPITLDARESVAPLTASEPSHPAAVLEHLTPRRNVITGALSKPVFKPLRPSAVAEPPFITGTQTNDLELGSGLLGVSAPSPAAGAKLGGHLELPKLVSSTPPAYPAAARIAKLGGVVVINALVDETGKVAGMKVISGPAILTQAAMESLRTWKYEPERLNGQPVAGHVIVNVNFNLP